MIHINNMDVNSMRKTKAILLLTTFLIMMSLIANVYATSITPELWEDWTSGEAVTECQEINSGGNYPYKVDEWDKIDENGNHGSFTIFNSDGYTFDWSSTVPVVAVIVKAGPDAYVYRYPGGSYGDTELYAPNDKEVSHTTFCMNINTFQVPETPYGTVMSLIAMLGALLFLKK